MPSWVVTGASRGLGYGWIKHLASQPGNIVVGIARNKAATEERLAKDGIKNVHILTADITDVKALQAAAQDIVKITGGGLDYLIHNAALVSTRSSFLSVLEDTPQGLEEDLKSSFYANVVGTAHTINALLPLIRKGVAKKVVVTSTGMADPDLINRFDLAIASPYAVTKAATNTLVSKFHAALGRSEGILFFAMSPGFVDTLEGRQFSEKEMEGMQAMGAKFATYAPHFKGPMTPQESVEAQLKVIERATVEEFGGDFVSHFGNKQWL